MIYATFAQGDVYVFYDIDSNSYICVNCRIHRDFTDFICETSAVMLDHLEDHVEQGHRVPDKTLVRIKREIIKGVKK